MAAKQKRIWMVGGGTAGHYVPLLAVAEILKRDDSIHLTYISDGDDKEMSLAHGLGLRPIVIGTGKIRRHTLSPKALFLNVRDLFRMSKGLLTAVTLIKKQQPRVIFTKGGPLAFPVALAARLTQIPVITHESDAIMGGTNRFISRFAEKVLTGFPATVYPYTIAHKITHVGIPLRPEFCRQHRHVPAQRRPMVLITGGSQGAQTLSELFIPILPDLLKHASVVHITGSRFVDMFRELKESLPEPLRDHYAVLDFTPDIMQYMREASVVVTRGSSTIFELATLHKPIISVPLPWSANNHQVRNAEIFAEHNAAIMLRQDNLTPERLYETIQSVLSDKQLAHELKEGTKLFACCDAAPKTADILKQYL